MPPPSRYLSDIESIFTADLASRPVVRPVLPPPAIPNPAPDWLVQARAHRWSDDDIEPVLTFLRDHPAHDAKVFRLAPSVRRANKADGEWARVPLPEARVELVERDRIVVRDPYGAAVHFGPSLPAWARCAVAFGWDQLVIGSLARSYLPWEAVTVSVDRLEFTPPEGDVRTLGWTSTDDSPPSIFAKHRPETFGPVDPQRVEPLIYPPSLDAVYRAWTAEDEAVVPAGMLAEMSAEVRRLYQQDAGGMSTATETGETRVDDQPSEAPEEIIPLGPLAPLVAYTDGSGAGAGGDTGIGVVVLGPDGQTILEASRFAGQGTNNTAELCAIWCALLVSPPGSLTIITDSEYSQGVLLHPEWRLKANEKLIGQVRKALAKRVETDGCEILHVHGHESCPDEHKPGNGRADYLAGLAVDRERAKRGQSIRRRKVTESPTAPSSEESWHSQGEAGRVPPVQVAEMPKGRKGTGGKAPAFDPHDPIELVVCDTETTGFSAPAGMRDRLVEIAAVVIRVADLDSLPPDGDPRDIILAEYNQLVHPGGAIPAASMDVHHITDAMVADAPRAKGILPGFAAFVAGRPLLFHNARYDRRVISGELKRAGLPALGVHAFCSLLAAQDLAVFPDNKLATLVKHFGVPSSPTHRALADIIATVGVLAGLRRKAREMGREWRLSGMCKWKGETL